MLWNVPDINPFVPHPGSARDLISTNMIRSSLLEGMVHSKSLPFGFDILIRIIRSCHILSFRGVVKIDIPCISQATLRVSRATNLWRFFMASWMLIFRQVLGGDPVTDKTCCSGMTVIVSLTGMAGKKLSTHKFGMQDPYYSHFHGSLQQARLAGVPGWL